MSDMSKLELLNVFVNDRLTAAAQDIFRAVKDTVGEYQAECQAELLRSREENQRLRQLLNAAVQRLLLRPESQSAPSPLNGQTDWSCEEGGALVKEEPTEAGQCVCRSPLAPVQVKTEREEPVESGPRSSSEHESMNPADCESTNLVSCESTSPVNCESTSPPENPPSSRPLPLFSGPGHALHKWHRCGECGKGFNFACQLEVHMRWHTKEKPYCCAVCRKSFTTVSMLKRHHRIHTGEKPFHCHVCGKSFNQSAHLNTHFRLHTREYPREYLRGHARGRRDIRDIRDRASRGATAFCK